MLPVHFRIFVEILMFVFEYCNASAPLYVSDLLQIYSPLRSLGSANHLCLVTLKRRLKTRGDRAFAVGPLNSGMSYFLMTKWSQPQTLRNCVTHFYFLTSSFMMTVMWFWFSCVPFPVFGVSVSCISLRVFYCLCLFFVYCEALITALFWILPLTLP